MIRPRTLLKSWVHRSGRGFARPDDYLATPGLDPLDGVYPSGTQYIYSRFTTGNGNDQDCRTAYLGSGTSPGNYGWLEKAAHAERTAFRNGTLQGAYLIVAARALGLDCGAMSGFDNARVDAEFFPDGRVKSNFLCNLGYGDPSRLYPRGPRLEFEEACRLL